MKRASSLAALLFFFSGAASLVYEVTWVKILNVHFGSSAWSVATVVACFMAGLGAGSWWAGRRAESIRRPFLAYGAIEIGIAVFGLASPFILAVADDVLGSAYALLEGRFFLFALARFALSLVLLLPPTVLMGASLPILVAGIARGPGFDRTVGILYGVNTMGGAAGVVAAGFFLLPNLGQTPAIHVAVAVGTLVGVAACLAQRFFAPPVASPRGEAAVAAAGGRLLAFALFSSGSLAIFYQIAWTRLLTPIVGSTTYAFSIILTTFLVGIAVGGLATGGPISPKRHHRAWVGGFIALTSTSVVGGLFLVDRLPEWFVSLARSAGERFWLLFLVEGLLSGALMFLPTWAMGVTLPLAISGYRAETGASGKAVGNIYAANTLGAILGSFLAGFVVLPHFGVTSSILAAAVAGGLLAALLVASQRGLARHVRAALAVLAVLPAAGLARALPEIDQDRIQRGYFRRVMGEDAGPASDGDLVFLREGLQVTVSVYRSPDETWLKVAGKTDASTGRIDRQTQYLSGHLPMFLSSGARRVCVVGYGSGATVRAVAAHDVESIDVAEIEPAVIEASPWFESINDRVLEDERVRLHLEDGRSLLRYRDETYDVVISEPSNPWIAGTGSLFTTEFYRIVKSRLNPGGILCQWIQRYEISQGTLAVLLRTLSDEFDHVLVFGLEADLLCLASNEPFRGDPERYRRLLEREDVKATLGRLGIASEYELLHRLVAVLPDDRGRFETPWRNTDENLWIESRAPYEMYAGQFADVEEPEPEVYLGRVARILFPGRSREEIHLGLARAIERVHPTWAPLIDALAEMTPDAARRGELEALSRESKARLGALGKQDGRLAFGGLSLDEGRPAEALEFFDEALAVEPDLGIAIRGKGRSLLALGRAAEAETELRRAIEVNPLDFEARVELGRLLGGSGRVEEALAEFERAAATDPRHVAAWVERILALRERGDEEGAREVEEEAARALGSRRAVRMREALDRP